MGHSDDGLYHRPGSAVLGDIDDERAVDLQGIHGKMTQVTKGGIAGSKIVDGNFQAQTAQASELDFSFVGVANEIRFCDFQLQASRIETGLEEHLTDGVGDVPLLELDD